MVATPIWGGAPALERVVVQLPYNHQFQFAGFYAAELQGYFAEENLAVELREATRARQPVEEVVVGRAQYGLSGPMALLARMNGAPIVALAAIFQHSPFALMVRADSGIATPTDLIGQRIAFNPTSSNLEVRAMFHLEGMKGDQLVMVPDKPQYNEILAGEAEAMQVFVTDAPFDAAADGLEYRLIRPADYGADFYGETFFASEKEVNAHPERAQAMRRALLRGWEYALDNPEEIIEWILETHGRAHPRLTRERLQFEAAATAKLINPDLVEIGHINPGRVRKLGELVVALGQAPDMRALDGWIYTGEVRALPSWTRWAAIGAGAAILLSLAALLANWRLKRLVERRTVELVESEKKQRELFDLAPTPIVVQDLRKIAERLAALKAAGVTDLRAHLAANPGLEEELFRLKRVRDANRHALAQTGFTNVEEMDRGLRAIMTPQAMEGFGTELQTVWEGGDRLVLEKIYRSTTGDAIHTLLQWSADPVEGPQDYRQVRMVFTDITKIRQAEQALQESEERYRNLFETTPNPMYIFDVETLRIVMVNEAAIHRYGYTREEFLGMTVAELRPADEAVRLQQAMKEYSNSPPKASGAHAAGMWRHRCKDGTILIVEVFTHSLLLNDRPCVLALPFDITAKLAAERALRDSESRYRELFENAVGGVYRATPEGRFISVNPAMARLYGFEAPAEMLAWREREHGGAAYADAKEYQRFADLINRHGKVENFETRIVDREGRTRWVSETSRVVRDEEGELLYYEGFVTDITDRRRLEGEMLRASKLEAVGVLAGGIAHDFNNILTVVLGNVTLAELDSGNDSAVSRMLHEAKRATLRARDLTQQLLTFAKGGDPVRASITLPELVRESAQFAMHGSKSRCEFDLPADLWPAHADKGQISQVVQNLVINAAQAMPQGGLVQLAAANVRLATGRGAQLPAGDYVKLTVRDNGTGISPEHLGKIFDPYFTTKQQGSGLGLATVYSIIQKHQGNIVVDSKLGEGTVFQLWLPAAAHEVSEVPAAEPAAQTLRARVLFMDDEAPIRDMAELYLQRLGGEFVGAADGREALRIYEEARTAGRPFDVVVMDLTVPGGMGGREAMAKLLVLDPAVRAIVSSGYSSDPVLGSYRRHGFCAILPKPYSLDQLQKVLVDVIARRGSGSPF
ncbi:MAG: ABC transporter substrate-binding protein [Candidatus Didemnitutus sp.]|nr:ABC transporter substrate-binding protein [Candidatus Didemnitutus sp.]